MGLRVRGGKREKERKRERERERERERRFAMRKRKIWHTCNLSSSVISVSFSQRNCWWLFNGFYRNCEQHRLHDKIRPS